MARFAVALCDELGWRTKRAARSAWPVFLHDVGKIGIPDQLLLSPAPSLKEEYDDIKKHSGVGALIIGEIPNLRDLRTTSQPTTNGATDRATRAGS